MSMIETVSDVNNTFLSRRELVCNFAGLGGRLKKLEATDMVSKEYGLDGKIIIPVRMASHVGKPLLTGTFYVYEDENLVKKQVDPTILNRLDRARKKVEEAEAEAAKKAEEEKAEAAKKAEEDDDDDAKAAEGEQGGGGEGDAKGDGDKSAGAGEGKDGAAGGNSDDPKGAGGKE